MFTPVRLARACHAFALLLLLLLLPLSAVAQAVGGQAVTGVGFHAISVRDPIGGGNMPGYVFYPSAHATGTTMAGPYQVAATRDAPVIPGAKPLVVISHGNGGSDLGHHDLATYLAAHGFIVATLEHPKDNFHDTSGVGSAAVLVGRPIQVSATISELLSDPKWKELIDANRIGVTGFSAGGYTGLLVVGAVPTFQRFIDYCQRFPNDQGVCHDYKRMSNEAAAQGQTIEQVAGRLQHDLTRWGNTADPRVKAAFVMAPLSLIFDQGGAASIDRPVFLYYAQNDHVLVPAENAEHLRPLLKTLVGTRMVPSADHWVFVGPCAAELAKENPTICTDPPSVDRVEVHKQIAIDALAFFRKTLNVPTK